MADKFQLAQKNRVGKSLRDAQRNKLMFYKGKDGKKKAAVTKEELGGLSLRDYLNKQQGKTRKKDTKTAKPVATNKDVVKTNNKGRAFVAPKERKKVSSVGSGAATTITGQAKTKSATQINRELKEKIKSPKVLGKKVVATNIVGAGTGTVDKKSANKKNKDVIKTGFLPKVIGKDIFSKKMRETADAAANKRAPDYMKKDNKKSDDKKRSKSLLKRVTGFATKPEVKKNKKISDRGKGIFFDKNKNKINNKKTTSSYNRKADPTAVSYRKGGGNVFVAKQYGGKII